MAFPTTLALITALWSGPGRTKSIALWSALGGGIAALGPLLAGLLLEHFWWGSVFLITLPLVAVALVMAVLLVPSHVNESTEPVDNLGGIVSVVLVGSLILSINFAPVPNKGALALGLAGVALVAAAAFVLRQRRAPNPLYDLDIARRRIFWVAACAGIIVFGTLMGTMFISQQYLQNVLGYSTLQAGAAFLPAIVCMVLIAPRSAKLVESHGARFTLLAGYVSMVIAFVWMLLLWSDDAPYWQIGFAYAFIGIGVGLAGTPASHSLTGSVPVQRAGMASGTADLQRDLGGAIMQSIMGAAADGRLRLGGRDRHRRLAEQQHDQRQRPEPADEVVRRRRRHRGPVPAVLRPDHRRRPHLVSAGRRLGLHRRPRRRAPRSRPGLDLLSPARRGATPARPLPRRGHRQARDPADGGPRGRVLTWQRRLGVLRCRLLGACCGDSVGIGLGNDGGAIRRADSGLLVRLALSFFLRWARLFVSFQPISRASRVSPKTMFQAVVITA